MTHALVFVELQYIQGLASIVQAELRSVGDYTILEINSHTMRITVPDSFEELFELRTVSHVYLCTAHALYTPAYIARHKSLLGGLIESVITVSPDVFKTYHISCAGKQSLEVGAIESYIQETFGLAPSYPSDLSIALAKEGRLWCIRIELSSRPLSVRPYKVATAPGAMDPTIACALLMQAGLGAGDRVLNLCSGTGTILIEASLIESHLDRLDGIESDKHMITRAIRATDHVGMLRHITYTHTRFQEWHPEAGIAYTVVVADLPFGMQIGKGSDLLVLYKDLCACALKVLDLGGRLAVYTAQKALWQQAVESFPEFTLSYATTLKQPTGAGYLTTGIYVYHLTPKK